MIRFVTYTVEALYFGGLCDFNLSALLTGEDNASIKILGNFIVNLALIKVNQGDRKNQGGHYKPLRFFIVVTITLAQQDEHLNGCNGAIVFDRKS